MQGYKYWRKIKHTNSNKIVSNLIVLCALSSRCRSKKLQISLLIFIWWFFSYFFSFPLDMGNLTDLLILPEANRDLDLDPSAIDYNMIDFCFCIDKSWFLSYLVLYLVYHFTTFITKDNNTCMSYLRGNFKRNLLIQTKSKGTNISDFSTSIKLSWQRGWWTSHGGLPDSIDTNIRFKDAGGSWLWSLNPISRKLAWMSPLIMI